MALSYMRLRSTAQHVLLTALTLDLHLPSLRLHHREASRVLSSLVLHCQACRQLRRVFIEYQVRLQLSAQSTVLHVSETVEDLCEVLVGQVELIRGFEEVFTEEKHRILVVAQGLGLLDTLCVFAENVGQVH